MPKLSSKVDERPAMQFYLKDWLADTRILNLAERGLWIDALAFMFRAPRRGYLIMQNGCKPDAEALRNLFGTQDGEAEAVIERLVAKGVASRDSRGVLYCRRMARESNAETAKSAAGRRAAKVRWDAEHMRNDGSPTPTPSPTPSPAPVSEGLELGIRNCADDSKSPPPPAEKSSSTPRSFRERLVDGCLMAFGKRYAKTRGQEYPGGLAALRESGFGVVTKRLKTLCPDVPYRKADEAGKTPEQIEASCKDALKVWGGYLDRAAAIHEAAKGIPGKDGDWLRFPASIGAFCGRIPKLTDADVDAAGKRAADVAEARKNYKRANPDTGSSVRYGDKENVIP